MQRDTLYSPVIYVLFLICTKYTKLCTIVLFLDALSEKAPTVILLPVNKVRFNLLDNPPNAGQFSPSSRGRQRERKKETREPRETIKTRKRREREERARLVSNISRFANAIPFKL